jgi:hypothetical protein
MRPEPCDRREPRHRQRAGSAVQPEVHRRHAGEERVMSGRTRLSVPPLQLSCVAGIDRYAIAIRIDQLEVVVTKELVLSNCVYRQSLFH